MPDVQDRNASLVDRLSGDFQLRYEPQFAWKSAVSSLLALPGLRAVWPMSSVYHTAADRIRDVSGNGNHLTDSSAAGAIRFGYATTSMIPYARFIADNSQYASRADGGASNWADITGTESYIIPIPMEQGLTCGVWVYFYDGAGSDEYILAKRTTVAASQVSYSLRRISTGAIRFEVSTDGSTIVNVDSTDLVTDSDWYHIVARFVPSTTLSVFVNGNETQLAAGVPASIFDSTTQFTLGARSDPTDYANIFLSMTFLCASSISDAIINQVYQQQRAMISV